jgi:hypothetical protein
MKTPVSTSTLQEISKFFTYYTAEEAQAEIEICMNDCDDAERMHLYRMVSTLIRSCEKLNCEIADNPIHLET